MGTKKYLSDRIKNVPQSPGVYMFKDGRGNVLYVGKARDLTKRIRSYWQKSHVYSPKTKVMIDKVADLDFYTTDNETEALVLEVNLIKRHRPDFNVNYRDDKSYPYLAITTGDDFPRLKITREPHRKKSEYYGPYTKAYAIRSTLDTLRRIFPVRTCSNAKLERAKKAENPCLDYHIKRCLGPCIGEISPHRYSKLIEEVRLFLRGRGNQVINRLEQEMKEASSNLEFEKAAHLRNRVQEAKHVLEKQKIISTEKVDQDVIGIAQDEYVACVELFVIRQGKLTGSETFTLKTGLEDTLSYFVKQYYLDSSSIPQTILLPYQIDDSYLVQNWLTERAKRKILLKVPKRGEKRKLVELAQRNAYHALEVCHLRDKQAKELSLQALVELKEELNLVSTPYRIECFDVSNIRGREAVGSMVVFENGSPKRSDYRRFKIREVLSQDDFAMMAEVIRRRFARFLNYQGDTKEKFGSRPDLVVVDGGKPQLKAALSSLQDLGIKNVPAVALAKGEDQVYLPSEKNPFPLPSASLSLHLMQRIRDEAHRFAVTYHRDLRQKKMVASILDGIPGVGEMRKQQLVNHFGTSKAVAKASLDELAKVPSISRKLAQNIYKHLHSAGGKK